MVLVIVSHDITSFKMTYHSQQPSRLIVTVLCREVARTLTIVPQVVASALGRHRLHCRVDVAAFL